MDGEIEDRIGKLIDRRAYADDAAYYGTVSMLRSWLAKTEMAMQDEGVDPRVIHRVLSRLVYAAPDGADAHVRMALKREQVELLMRGTKR